jgi:hypothetical protein
VSHFITVPINENGIIYDVDMNDVVKEAILENPFRFEDVFVYSHGWSTNTYGALDEYNRFSTDLAKRLLTLPAVPPLSQPPRNSLGVGIHWPSEITEDPKSTLNDAQLFTFYAMEQRADAVGRNAVYSMLRLMLSARAGSTLPLRIFLLGHSFGCKVLCAALNDLQIDIANKTIQTPATLSFRVVLLEAATDDDNLEPGDIYGSIKDIPDTRLLMTTSSEDKALNVWYPLASKIANLFHENKAHRALGATGPTASTITAFGGSVDHVTVVSGFTFGDMLAHNGRLVLADLSAVHKYRESAGLYNGGFSGSHSDITFEELYDMVIGFLFA